MTIKKTYFLFRVNKKKVWFKELIHNIEQVDNFLNICLYLYLSESGFNLQPQIAEYNIASKSDEKYQAHYIM